MKSIWKSFTLAMSMYSRIPMPQTQWDHQSMGYVFCFFPLTGVIIGLVQLVWFCLAARLQIDGLLFGVVTVIIGLAITGGIHMDGFCDTCDALGSHQQRERKLEILKDSHIGAFALVGCVVYLLLEVALWQEARMDATAVAALVCIPVLSRSLSGMLSVWMKNARGAGLLDSFSSASVKGAVTICLGLWLTGTCVVLVTLAGWYGVAVMIASALVVIGFIRMAMREFGGITGDLAGWFLQMCRLACLLSLVLVQKVSVLL